MKINFSLMSLIVAICSCAIVLGFNLHSVKENDKYFSWPINYRTNEAIERDGKSLVFINGNESRHKNEVILINIMMDCLIVVGPVMLVEWLIRSKDVDSDSGNTRN